VALGKEGPVGLIEDVGRRRGDASGFGWRCSTAVGELRGLAVTKAWPYSSEEEGRSEAAPRIGVSGTRVSSHHGGGGGMATAAVRMR
jgi:hypothetical protein